MISLNLNEMEADESQANYFHLMSTSKSSVNIKVVYLNEGQSTSYIRSPEGRVKYLVISGSVTCEERADIPSSLIYKPEYFALNTPPQAVSLPGEESKNLVAGEVCISSRRNFSRVKAKEKSQILQIVEHIKNTVEFTNR